MTSLRLGAKLPNSGPLPLERGVAAMAAELESAGFESLWVSDHVVMPREIGSHYPFAEDGRATWPTDAPYFEALMVLAVAATATTTATVGTAVLVAPMRNPVLLAKQAATLQLLSGGRLALGLGAGWLAEEFAALGAPFERRGGRLAEWIEILRACWSGTPDARSSDFYELPADVLVLPALETPVPLLLGGHSPAALRRAGRRGDGWLAQQSLLALDPAALADEVAVVRAAADEAGRDPEALRVVLRVVDSATRADVLAARLGDLAAAGVAEVIVDVAPDERPQDVHDALRAGVPA